MISDYYWAVPELSLPCRNPLADVGIFPLKWFGCFLVEPDIAQDLAFQIGNGSEDAAVDDVALELAEPSLDLIEPRRVGRGEVQIHIGMVLQEVLDEFRFVRGKVVQDDVHLALDGLGRNDFFQERDKLLTGMSSSGLSQDLAGLRIQSRVQ